MSAHARAQAARVVRLLAFALTAQPVVAALASSSLVRYPLVAALVAAAEAGVRQVWPVKPLPRVVSEPAAAAAPAPPGAGS